VWLARRLTLPDDTPLIVSIAVFGYLYHLFCAGWVASSEAGAFLAMIAAAIAIWRRELRPSFHILYFPLALYAIDSTISALFAFRAIHSLGENALWFKILLFPTALILFRNVPRVRQLALRALRGRQSLARAFRSLVMLSLFGAEPDPDRATAYIGSLAVAPGWQGQGLGSALLAHMEEAARSAGKSRLALHVVDTNTGARRLYERHGFRVARSEFTLLARPIWGYGAVLYMVKPLR